jgi:hypothetical protein
MKKKEERKEKNLEIAPSAMFSDLSVKQVRLCEKTPSCASSAHGNFLHGQCLSFFV